MTAAEVPDLTVITVNYNCGSHLLACIEAVFRNTRGLTLEYFVVDNASRPDGTFETLRANFPQVRLLMSERNLGFAGGCNLALERARGRYILLLNPDTVVGPSALDRMLAFLDSRRDIGVLGSPLVSGDGRDQRVAGRGFPGPLAALFGRTTLLTRVFPNNRFSARFSSRRDSDRREPYEVDWVSGACMMVRREAVADVGMLDSAYFLMWEDTDWCFRMKRAGWKVYCVHDADVVHREGASRNVAWSSLWISTVAFHKGAYRYYRLHINARAFHPAHLLVIGALAGRTALLLTTRSIKRIARGRPTALVRHRNEDPEPVHR